MLPGPYNNDYQIVQTPEYVMILVEQIHDVRIIRLDGRPHLPANVRQWMGDSLGRWEGDTLVVDTTNFTDKTGFRGSSDGLHVIERHTRRREHNPLPIHNRRSFNFYEGLDRRVSFLGSSWPDL